MGPLIHTSDAIRLTADSYRRGQVDMVEVLVEGFNNPSIVALHGDEFTARANAVLAGMKDRIPDVAHLLALFEQKVAAVAAVQPVEPTKPVWDNNPKACCLHDGERALAIVRHSDGKWFGYDARFPNEAGDGLRQLGSFMSLEAAKRSVEQEVCVDA